MSKLKRIPNRRRFGGIESYAEFENDGTLVFYDNGTTWDDITNSLSNTRLSSNSGKLDYNYEENSINAQSGGSIMVIDDRLIVNIQYPHAAIEQGMMNFHIHWIQPTNSNYQFTTRYRVQSNNAPTVRAWTTVIRNSNDYNAFTYPGSGDFNQITSLAEISLSGTSISSTVQIQFARTDSIVGTIELVFADAHVQKNMLGSREEYVK